MSMETGGAPTSAPAAPTTQGSANQPSSNSVQNGSSENNSSASPSSQKTAPSQSEYFEVKVNGKTQKMTRDEVISHAQMSHAAHAKFEEAATIKRQVDRIIHTAKNNPIDALMDPSLGLSKEQIRDAFEKWYTQEFIEPETLTPEQKKSKEMERKLEKYEQAEKDNREKAEREQQEKMTSNQREYLQDQIIQAMEKSGLPKTKFFAQRMAFYMRENLLKGWDAPLDMIVSQVKKEHRERNSDLTENASVEQLIDMFGEGIINKIRKHDLEQLRKRRQFPKTSDAQTDGYGNPQNNEKISMSEVNRRLQEIRMGKR